MTFPGRAGVKAQTEVCGADWAPDFLRIGGNSAGVGACSPPTMRPFSQARVEEAEMFKL